MEMPSEDTFTLTIPVTDRNGRVVDSALLTCTSETSFYDIQEMLRQRFGAGNIVCDRYNMATPIGEHANPDPRFTNRLADLFQTPQEVQNWIYTYVIKFIPN